MVKREKVLSRKKSQIEEKRLRALKFINRRDIRSKEIQSERLKLQTKLSLNAQMEK